VTTVDAWLDGSAQPATLASDRLAGLAEVLDRLEAAGMVEADIRGEWLRAPNAAFEGRAPLDVVALGDADRVVSYVAVLS
jgi:hypothetical protein